MFCPNCGTSEQMANAYCKRCGVWLTEMRAVRHKSPEESLKVIAVFSTISAAFILFSTIVLYTILFSGNKHWTIALAGAFGLVVFIYQIFNVIYSLNLRQRIKRGRESIKIDAPLTSTGEFNAANTFASLRAPNTGEMIQPATVTEQTTVLLEPRTHRKK